MKLTCTSANASQRHNVSERNVIKKIAALVLALALACAPLAGCASNSTSSTSSAASSSSTTTASSASSDAQSAAQAIKVTVNVTGDYNDTVVDDNAVVELEEDATVLDALKATGFDIDVQDSSYGPYVTSIQGLAATGSNGWTYTVNGEMATVSAGEYKLANDDVVDWSYFVS